MENTGANGRIGVVIRETLSKGSKYAFIGTSPDGRFRWQYRNSTGGKTASTLSTTGAPPNIWTRLARSGNTLAGYKSIDGTNWSLVSSRNLSMATNIFVGLAVASWQFQYVEHRHVYQRVRGPVSVLFPVMKFYESCNRPCLGSAAVDARAAQPGS